MSEVSNLQMYTCRKTVNRYENLNLAKFKFGKTPKHLEF